MFRDRILAVMGNAKFGSKPYYISMLMSEFTEAHDILFETGTGEFAAVVTPNTYAGSDAQAKLEMDVASWLADDNNVMLGHRFNVVAPVEKTLNVHIQNSRPSTESYLWFQGIRQEDVEKVKELIRIYFYGGSSSYVAYECQGLNIGEEVTAEDMRSLLKEVFDMTEFVGAMNEKLGDADVYRLVFP